MLPNYRKQRFIVLRLAAVLLLAACVSVLAGQSSSVGKRPARSPGAAPGLRFELSFSYAISPTPIDGRLFLLISTDAAREPRFEISDRPDTQQMFGLDVDALAPDSPALIDRAALGYPLDSVAQIPAGDYTVQGVLNIYETFHRADGRVLKLPMDQGEGQQWDSKPGNLYSRPEKVHIDPAAGGVIRIHLTERIPPIEPPQDTKYVKHLRIRSDLLSKFWGRPMELGALVLLPEGWDEHPDARYPLMVLQGHFSHDIFGRGLRTQPPTPEMKGVARTSAEYGYKFYQDWISGRLPRMIILEIQHPNPYYDDSYAVNSANVGPYGDAITQELIPAVEQKFRGIGQGWARGLYGGSTGGWEALGMQVFYPDFFNGTWCMCPDPVDFRAYQIVNIYDDKNALWTEGPWSRIARPSARTPDDAIITTMDRENRRELVLGTHGRSADQYNIWQAVFSPVGDDGYPKPIWDPLTGVIDHQVAAYWREHYDLRYILERDWKTLGPKLVGKIHVKVGTRDTYYLDNAVRLLEQFLSKTNNPYYAGDFEYGPHLPHCFSGDPHTAIPPATPREAVTLGYLTIHQRVLPQAADWMARTAPPGADVTSWKY